ncbi:PP2C family protein-serine/threonine phosphatase [Streptomyces chiangmaiensis]|uniref:PP2C family protein-serine/threonine phosphatase n=1 Tax=Streptomyces chiangmaiensis TaxID=766497 RepID=A0ABU7FSC8_9ACTN|nr:PP2C family protein-serine/threonine phosphatase [Streptomyces chiangmaiensis]MED7826894.1 PP2C family protein-serine/threonine phosphatase [Streptomyces chiangmaiensis]
MVQQAGARWLQESYDDEDRLDALLSGEPVDVPVAGDVHRPSPAERETRRLFCARAFLSALPVLLIAVGTCYDCLTPSDVTAGPLFTAAPLVAAPLYSLRGTVLTGLAAVVAVLGVHLGLGLLGRAGAITEAVTIVTVAVLAVLINVLVRRKNERLASAREIAEAAQRAVLPEPAARIGGLDIAARYEAAQAGTFIGGDLYAVQDTPHGVRLVVGDVRGKGMGAVAVVAVVIGAFREAAEQESTPEAVAQRLERALSREGTRRDGLDAVEGFTTAVLVEIPHGGGLVRILNRGHPAPLMLLPDGSLRVLEARENALPLGMGDLEAWPDRAEEWDFPPGATLLLYTDGVSEARDAQGEFYDPAAGLAGRVFPGPGALLAALTEAVARHTGGRATDDMALLAVRRPERP